MHTYGNSDVWTREYESARAKPVRARVEKERHAGCVTSEESERGTGRTRRQERERKSRRDTHRERAGARIHARACTHTTRPPKKLHGRGAATGKPNRARIKCFGQSRSQSLYD